MILKIWILHHKSLQNDSHLIKYLSLIIFIKIQNLKLLKKPILTLFHCYYVNTVQTLFMKTESSVCFQSISECLRIVRLLRRSWKYRVVMTNASSFKAHLPPPPFHPAPLLSGKVIQVTVPGYENTIFHKPKKVEKLQLYRTILH